MVTYLPTKTYGVVEQRLPRQVSSNLCDTCLDFEQNFARPTNLIKPDVSAVKYFPHKTWEALQQSSRDGCQLCKLLFNGYIDTMNARRRAETSETMDDTKLWIESKLKQHYSTRPSCLEVNLQGLNSIDGYGGYRVSFKPGGSLTSGYRWDECYFFVAVEPDRPPFHEDVRFDRGRICSSLPDTQLAKEWIKNCMDHHENCRKNKNAIAAEKPTRLLQINEDVTSVRLISTTQSSDYEYVALSHRWGIKKPALTLRCNMQERMQGFSVSTLPRTFRDAMTSTRGLGYEFIWIDSLCIIQDDEADWVYECPRMSIIYRGAVVTIATPAAPDSSAGFLHERKAVSSEDYKPCPLQYRDEEGAPRGSIKFWYPGCHSEAVPQSRPESSTPPQDVLRQQPGSVLENRGWILQEWLLSTRVLYFGSYQMYFECLSTARFESTHTEIRLQDSAKRLSKHIPSFRSPVQFYSWWRQFVERYSECVLSVAEDRLPAISGILHAVKPVQLGDTYLAGIWKGSLPWSLIWRLDGKTYYYPSRLNYGAAKTQEAVSGSPASCAEVNAPYVAPSWSWAAKMCKIRFVKQELDNKPVAWKFRFVSCSTTLPANPSLRISADPYGRVTGGSLHVRGKLRRAVVARYSEQRCFMAYALPFETRKGEEVAFFPDDIPRYSFLPVAEDRGNGLGHNPTTEEVQYRAYPEIYALEVGFLEMNSGVALALEPVPGKPGTFRRVGLIHFFFGHVEDLMKQWWDGIDEELLEVI